MKIKNEALRTYKKIRIRKRIITLLTVMTLCVLAYVLHSILMQLILNQKSIGEGLPIYSVEQTNHTDAYGWFVNYPKIDNLEFDKKVSKYVNDAKGTFLARTNFDTHGSYPKDDLNISYKLATHDDTTISVILVGEQVLTGQYSSWARQITYNHGTGQVTDTASRLAAIMSNANVSSGVMPEADSMGIDCQTKKCLALVFTGGPSYATSQLLDVLKNNHVKATFFELGSQVSRYSETAKRTVSEGNIIGNGTYSYRNLMTMSENDATNYLASSADAIKAVTGIRPGLVNAPYEAITNDMAQAVNQVFIQSNVEENSWQSGNSDAIYKSILLDAKPGLILQSFDTDQITVDAFKKAIPALMKQGYSLVTVPQLLNLGKTTKPGVYSAND